MSVLFGILWFLISIVFIVMLIVTLTKFIKKRKVKTSIITTSVLFLTGLFCLIVSIATVDLNKNGVYLGTSDGKFKNKEHNENVNNNDKDVSDVTTKNVNIEKTAGNVKYKITKIGKAKFDPNASEHIMLFNGDFKTGEKVGAVYAEFEVENTSDKPVDFYLDQSEIITNTGEQIDPSLAKLDGNLKSEMKGKVKSKGSVIWQLKNSKINNVKSFKLIVPRIIDSDLNEISQEEQIDLSF